MSTKKQTDGQLIEELLYWLRMTEIAIHGIRCDLKNDISNLESHIVIRAGCEFS